MAHLKGWSEAGGSSGLGLRSLGYKVWDSGLGLGVEKFRV